MTRLNLGGAARQKIGRITIGVATAAANGSHPLGGPELSRQDVHEKDSTVTKEYNRTLLHHEEKKDNNKNNHKKHFNRIDSQNFIIHKNIEKTNKKDEEDDTMKRWGRRGDMKESPKDETVTVNVSPDSAAAQSDGSKPRMWPSMVFSRRKRTNIMTRNARANLNETENVNRIKNVTESSSSSSSKHESSNATMEATDIGGSCSSGIDEDQDVTMTMMETMELDQLPQDVGTARLGVTSLINLGDSFFRPQQEECASLSPKKWCYGNDGTTTAFFLETRRPSLDSCAGSDGTGGYNRSIYQ